MATDALGNTIAVDQTYLVAGVCKLIDGDKITLVLGDKGEAKIRVKAGAIARLSDISGGGTVSPWKMHVRCASVSDGTFSTAFDNGSVVDGITIATGDRILIRAQTDQTKNGIYTVNASGDPTRATDADVGSELVGAVVHVREGTAYADQVFLCYQNAITLGVTNIQFAQLSNFIGPIDGSLITDATLSGSKLIEGTVDILMLLGAGLNAGSILYCDGSVWKTLDPPAAKSRLTHDGGSDPPYWDPV